MVAAARTPTPPPIDPPVIIQGFTMRVIWIKEISKYINKTTKYRKLTTVFKVTNADTLLTAKQGRPNQRQQMSIVTIATFCLPFSHVFDRDRRLLEKNRPVITSTTERPRIVVRPKHVHLVRSTRTSRSARAGRNVGVYLTQLWCRLVRFEHALAS